MKNNLFGITFDKTEKVNYLKSKGYKIETHKTSNGSYIMMSNGPIKGGSYGLSPKEYAIPNNEEFDVKTHKTIDETFDILIKKSFKDFLLNY